MKPSEFKISFSVKSYDKKLLKITEIAMLRKSPQFSNYQRYRFQILIAQIGVFNEDCVKISNPDLIYFQRNMPSNSVTTGSGRFIILSDSTSPN